MTIHFIHSLCSCLTQTIVEINFLVLIFKVFEAPAHPFSEGSYGCKIFTITYTLNRHSMNAVPKMYGLSYTSSVLTKNKKKKIRGKLNSESEGGRLF